MVFSSKEGCICLALLPVQDQRQQTTHDLACDLLCAVLFQ